MHILLTILAVIGWILLVILGLVILILLLVLLVPFRYKLHVEKSGDIAAGASVTWLLHFVKVSVFYIQKKIDLDVRICGFSLKKLLFGEKKPKEKKEKKPKEKAVKEKKAKKPKKKKAPKKIMPGENAPKKVVKEAKSAAKAEQEKVQKAEIENRVETVVKVEKPEEPKVTKTVNKTKPRQENFEKDEKPAGIIEKIKIQLEKIKGIINTGKLWGNAFLAIKGYLFKIIRHIIPKKLKGSLKFGLEDPATTGQILAVYCALYPVTPKDLTITPVFEEPVMECDIDIKGRVILIVLAINGLKIFFNKKVKAAMGR